MKKFFRRYRIFLIIAGFALLALAVIAAVYGERLNPLDGNTLNDFDSQDRASTVRLNELLSRPLVTTAPGCEIRSPTGELVNQLFQHIDTSSDAEVLLEAGSTINGDCFPEPDIN